MVQYNVTTSGTHLQGALVDGGNGDPSITLANLVSTGLQTVANIAALRTAARKAVPTYVKGFATENDGGQGFFMWDAADARTMVTAATINAAGSGYFAGSEIWLNGGTSTGPARWQVTTVDGAGAITGISMLDGGKYSVNPTLTASSVGVMGTGSGCTLNLTMGPLDDGGTVIPLNAGGTGRWKRYFTGPMNVMWFGAKADGTTDDQPAIQKAISAGSRYDPAMLQFVYGPVYVPPGRYLVNSSIILLPGSHFHGSSHRTSNIIGGATLTAPIIRTNVKMTNTQRDASDYTKRKRVIIERLFLTGSCEHAIQVVGSTESTIRDVYCRAASSSHQIYLSDSWNFDLFNVKTIGGGTDSQSACLYVGRDMNAFICTKFETSNGCKYGIYHSGDNSGATNIAGHGVSYIDCCLQGHTDTALYVASNGYGGMVIQNLYTESNRQAISLGEETTSRVVRGCSIVGGILGGDSGKPGKATICIWRGDGISITGSIIDAGGNAAHIGLGLARRVTVVGASAGYNVAWGWTASNQTSADMKIKTLATTSGGYVRKVRGFFCVDDYGNDVANGGTMIYTTGYSPTNSGTTRMIRYYWDDDQTPPVMIAEKFTMPSVAFATGGAVP